MKITGFTSHFASNPCSQSNRWKMARPLRLQARESSNNILKADLFRNESIVLFFSSSFLLPKTFPLLLHQVNSQLRAGADTFAALLFCSSWALWCAKAKPHILILSFIPKLYVGGFPKRLAHMPKGLKLIRSKLFGSNSEPNGSLGYDNETTRGLSIVISNPNLLHGVGQLWQWSQSAGHSVGDEQNTEMETATIKWTNGSTIAFARWKFDLNSQAF